VGDLRMICVYVPNGQAVGSDKYHYKLEWLAALRDYIVDSLQTHPRLVVSGDFNIAPTVEDTHDPDRWEGNILCSDAERAALTALLDTGLTDAFTCIAAPEQRFTWWDYRQGGFRRGHGLRIDHHLISAPLVGAMTDFRIDIEPRRWERPSDHTPVLCELREN
jgi:exodeoxyribonuclease III